MRTGHTNPLLPAIVYVAALLVFFCVCGRAEATYIRETFYNFDMTLPPDADFADAAAITLQGINPDDILTTYTGEQSRGWAPRVEGGTGSATVFWTAPIGDFLLPGESIHLGLMLRSGAPPVTAAEGGWYFGGSLDRVIPLVWQNWEGHPDSSVGAILLPPSEFPSGTTTIATSMIGAPSPYVFPLDLLTRDNEDLGELQWDFTGRFNDFNITSPPAEQLFASPPADAKAVLVRYGVWERPFIQAQDRRILFTNEAHIVHSPNPQPFLLPPVDFLGERPNLVFGTVNLFATERTGLWDDQIQQTIFEFSDDGGQTWNLIGRDDDGDIPTEATDPSPPAHNWWSVPWDVSQLEEGPKLLT